MPMLLDLHFPTVEEFIAKASSQGATLKETTIMGPNGPVIVRYLQRTASDGRILNATLPNQPKLYGNDLRGLCNRLQMDIDQFGYTMEKYFDNLGGSIDPYDTTESH